MKTTRRRTYSTEPSGRQVRSGGRWSALPAPSSAHRDRGVHELQPASLRLAMSANDLGQRSAAPRRLARPRRDSPSHPVGL